VSIYCTYFDNRYLSRGAALIESLREHGDMTPIIVLCLDSITAGELEGLGLNNVSTITLPTLEAEFPQLLDAKSNRSTTEYYFTLTPWLCLYALDSSSAEMVTYLDADLFFYANPEVMFTIIGDSDVAIVPHRFPDEQRWREKFGTYNVGWVSFRSSVSGRICLRWWADSCLDWCLDTPENGRFADQGYLDSFFNVVSADRISVVDHPGVNLAPWNLARHELDMFSDGRLRVDGEDLIFFHFHGLQQNGDRYYLKHAAYKVRTTKLMVDELYRPYILRLRHFEARLNLQPTRNLERRANFASVLQPGRKSLLRMLARIRGDSLTVAS